MGKQEKQNARVLISILNWNKAAETLNCVASIASETAANGLDITTLVIDNGSRAEDFRSLENGLRAHRVSLKRLPENTGFTGGHNISIKIAIDESYDFIWLLNNDAIVMPGCLNELVAAMRAEPRCGLASPVIRNLGAEDTIAICLRTHDCRLRSYRQIDSIEEAKKFQAEHPEQVWLVGTASFFRVEALKNVGPLDERLFAYYDDDDIGVRLAAGGWHSRCVFTASVAHESKRTPGQYPPYFYYLMYRNEMLFWQKHTPRKHRRFLWLKLLDTSLFNVNKLYQKGWRIQGDAALLGVSDFIRGRFGPPALGGKPHFALRLLCKIASIWNRWAE
jgi:GT2 family glycosyltransferase